MKRFLQRTKEIAQTVAGRVTRAINPPLAGDAKPLDIQHAILEAIELRAQPVGGGRRALPDRYVKVRVFVRNAAEKRALVTVLAGIRELALKRLREVRCDVAPGFRVDVSYVRRRSASAPTEAPMTIEFDAAAPAASARGSQTAPPALKLTVLRGRAAAAVYRLREPVVRVGRSETPVDHRGRVRQNHLAFLEDGDAHSKTVGRGHCEIRYDASAGEYRIFDEGSANGTRILREGQTIDVPAKDPFGVVIASGDELQFGTAAVRVEIQTPQDAR